MKAIPKLLNSQLDFDRALIIADPWIGKTLSQEKIWEMRTTPPPKELINKTIGLIRKGSGLIVGEGRLYQPFTEKIETVKEFMLNRLKHRIPFDSLNWDRWPFPWGIDQVIEYSKPIPYKHPQGAVIWVKITDEVLKGDPP